MKRQQIIIAAVLVAAAGAGGWAVLRHAGAKADAGEGADGAEVAATALVQTARVQQQALPLSLSVFGDVAPGKVEALSFPQAGQLVRLAVVPGQQVHRGDVVAVIASDPAAQSAYAQAANGLAFAKRELARNRELLALQLATQSQVDAAAHQLQDAEAAMAAQAKLGGAAASANLAATVDGAVVATPVAQGERVQAGTAVVQLGRTDTLRVQLALDPAQSATLRAGMPVTIAGGAAPVAATLSEIGRAVDPKTQMVTAVVALPAAKQGALIAGMHVQAEIELGKRQAWVVPRAAVLVDDRGAYLYQVVNGKAQRVDVAKLAETAQNYGVDGKLDAQRPVVVLGNYELQDGMAVREAVR